MYLASSLVQLTYLHIRRATVLFLCYLITSKRKAVLYNSYSYSHSYSHSTLRPASVPNYLMRCPYPLQVLYPKAQGVGVQR